MTAFIVEESAALGALYLWYGVWEIMTRKQLDDGRWIIECRRYN